MTSVIHFIGIITFVTTTSLTPGPPHLLIPRYPDIISADNNVISVPHALVDTGTTWPVHSSTADGNDLFEIGTRNISIGGTGAFSNGVARLPHLTCCCADMKNGLKSDYEDPTKPPAEKKAAQVTLGNGTLVSVVDPTTSAYHIDLVVTTTEPQLVITGTQKDKDPEKIVINLPTSGPAPDIVFLNQPNNAEHDSHWHSYYRMGIGSITCTENPKNDPATCSPQPEGCLATSSMSTKAKPKSLSAKVKKLTSSKTPFHRTPKGEYFVDINCSGSQWP